MATSTQQVAQLMLADINAPQTADNVKAMTAWINAENSDPTLRNNPLNLHSPGANGQMPTASNRFVAGGPLPGQTGSEYVSQSDQDVAVFGSIQAGVQANANNLVSLSQSNPQYGYGAVLNAFRSGNSEGALVALGNSSWAGSHYQAQDANGNYIPGTNTLVDAYNGVAAGTSQVSTASSDTTYSDLFSQVLGQPSTYVLQQSDIDKVVAYLVNANPPSAFNNFTSAQDASNYYHGIFDKFVGQPISAVSQGVQDIPSSPFDVPSGGVSLPGVDLSGIQSALQFGGIVFVGVALIIAGAVITLKRQNA